MRDWYTVRYMVKYITERTVRDDSQVEARQRVKEDVLSEFKDDGITVCSVKLLDKVRRTK